MNRYGVSNIREKIERADKYIKDFKAELASFNATQPYSLRVDVEGEPRKPSVHILKADPLPPSACLILGDAIHNLRSALDYLACSLVRANRTEPTPKTEFPILDGPLTTTKREARFAGKVEGMRKDVIQAIRDIHPYKGGNDTLWRLHRLDVIDKHNMLVTGFGSITAVGRLPSIQGRWDGNRFLGVPGIPPVMEAGQKFTVSTMEVAGFEVKKNTGFFAEIVFHEPGVAEGYPVILALNEFRTVVIKT